MRFKLIFPFASLIFQCAFTSVHAFQYQIVVYKTDYILELYKDSALVKTYPIALGFNPVDDKNRRGDGCTPEGDFYVCRIDPNSIFYKAFMINYPNLEDAQRGHAAGMITQAQFLRFQTSIRNRQIPPQDTKLGSDILIHGGGIGYNWTLGCVALRNEDIDEFFHLIVLGTPVRIQRSKY